jgi:nucleotide-binding universal stress UspA family protein
MFEHILIPTDGSDLSRKAMLYGMQLAKLSKARVTALSIRPPFGPIVTDAYIIADTQDDFERGAREVADRALAQAAMAGDAAGVLVETAQEEHDQPFRSIINCARANACDLIVMASHGRRGVSALLLGSETQKVLTHCHIPVLIYR